MNTPTRSYPELRFRLTVIIRYVAGRDGRSIRDVYRQAMSAFEGDAVQPFEHVEAFEVYYGRHRAKIDAGVEEMTQTVAQKKPGHADNLFICKDLRRSERRQMREERQQFIARCLREYAKETQKHPPDIAQTTRKYALMIYRANKNFYEAKK